ncbi:segregation and condensation protein A [Streptomyces sp. NPDC060064]|uniref:segregation and condensation protein A n=1 Tax=Streptomyces sp. NPDC060064 TaxID=3347049 RepID=UPI0036885D70
MPPTDDSTRPPRRSLGRGPGTDRGGSPPPALPAPEPGDERLERGGADGEPAVVAPGEISPTPPLPAASTGGSAAGADEAPGPGRPLRGDNDAPEGPAGAPVEAEPELPARAEATAVVSGPEPAAPEAGVAAGGGEALGPGRLFHGDDGGSGGPEAVFVPGMVAEPGGGEALGPDRLFHGDDGGPAGTAVAEPPGSSVAAEAEPAAPAAPAPAVPATPPVEPAAAPQTPDDGRFKVRLANFEGPFDLLLQLISKHKLDVTEVALSKVTDEFMVHIRAMGPDWDLDQTTEFLVVAATLLDLKAARLLPAAEVEDEADLALLEARDLLFARLLQYRAYKQIAEIFSARLDAEGKRYPRTVGLEDHHAELLPEVVISIGAEGFARLAVKAMQPRPKPQVYIDHIHAPLVSVREQAEVVVARLREAGEVSFRELAADAPDTLTVVARFLALLELYREKAVILDQEHALGELMVRWTGGEGAEQPLVTDEFDQEVRENQEQEGNA